MQEIMTTKGTVVVRVPEILKARGITVGDFAEGTGLAYNTASAWARGYIDRVDLRTLAAVCDYLKLPTGDILVHVPEEDPKIQ